MLSLSLSLSLETGVLLDSGDELLSALGVLDVLNSQVDSLLKVSVSNNLVDDDTNRGLGHVVHDTSLSLVVLVGHTLLDSSISLDVDNVAHSVGLEVSRERDGSVTTEVPREGVTGARSVSATLSHFLVSFSV